MHFPEKPLSISQTHTHTESHRTNTIKALQPANEEQMQMALRLLSCRSFRGSLMRIIKAAKAAAAEAAAASAETEAEAAAYLSHDYRIK